MVKSPPNVSGEERSRALLRDTAACYRFVKTTAAACKLSSGFPSYLETTRTLLSHIGQLSASTLDFLKRFPSQIPDNPADYRRRRQNLLLIRDAWSSLHRYVQPAVDADTLSVPTELVRLLTDRVQLLEKCESQEFAVIHTNRLNYFQFPPGDFEETMVQLGKAISAQPGLEFPSSLGLIALPNSQANHLFLNGLLAHEIGHIVFAKLNILDRINSSISKGLADAFKPPADLQLKDGDGAKLHQDLEGWAEELFCDLFGVHLLGPSFVLASIEFFDLANLLTLDGKIDKVAAKSHFEFETGDPHPAKLFRVWRQADLLDRLGWWDKIADCASHHVQLMSECRALQQGSLGLKRESEQHGAMVIDAFFRSIQVIEDEVWAVASPLRNDDDVVSEVRDFTEVKKEIWNCLRHAIVPSTLWIDGAFRIPSETILLNAAHLFYLSGIEDLIAKSDGPNVDGVGLRDIWMERVENWTTKALEDISMSRNGEK